MVGDSRQHQVLRSRVSPARAPLGLAIMLSRRLFDGKLCCPRGCYYNVALLDRYGSKAWMLLPELATKDGDTVLDEKCTYDMFHNTRLKQLLDDQGVDTVVISGVMTNLCCETTARYAFVVRHFPEASFLPSH